MRVLVFDTETTGLPKSKIINPDTLHMWPHIVQLSYIIYDTELMCMVEVFDYIARMKENITIPPESTAIHGITNEMSNKIGIPIEEILNEFFYYLQTVDTIVGHNVSFDVDMIKIELLRIIYAGKLSNEKNKLCKMNLHYITNFKNIRCTMKETIQLCNIPAIDYYGKPYSKYPKLVELYKKLFESEPKNLHNALNDIVVTLRCFIKLNYKKDILDDKDEKYSHIYSRVFGLH
jgi:DNA polymerase III epsilon subunit-like protein